jgi:hypothetical protein
MARAAMAGDELGLRLVLVVLVAGRAVINAAGVYAQLVATHVGGRGAAKSAIETLAATLAARIDVQTRPPLFPRADGV